MKKNKMMRIASVLLVAVLLSTCAISGTFAKYVTAHSSSDTARVAYWGFKETTFAIDNLFSNAYDNVSGAEDVIAPGTSGSATFSFKPQTSTAPEVAYKITVSTEGSSCDDDIVANTNIQWKLDNGEYGTFADLRTAIESLSTDVVAAGQFDSNWGATSEHTVYWQWLINENSDANNEQNIKDTALANKDFNSLDTVNLVISIIAEQVAEQVEEPVEEPVD